MQPPTGTTGLGDCPEESFIRTQTQRATADQRNDSIQVEFGEFIGGDPGIWTIEKATIA